MEGNRHLFCENFLNGGKIKKHRSISPRRFKIPIVGDSSKRLPREVINMKIEYYTVNKEDPTDVRKLTDADYRRIGGSSQLQNHIIGKPEMIEIFYQKVYRHFRKEPEALKIFCESFGVSLEDFILAIPEQLQ